MKIKDKMSEHYTEVTKCPSFLDHEFETFNEYCDSFLSSVDLHFSLSKKLMESKILIFDSNLKLFTIFKLN